MSHFIPLLPCVSTCAAPHGGACDLLTFRIAAVQHAVALGPATVRYIGVVADVAAPGSEGDCMRQSEGDCTNEHTNTGMNVNS